ncbi:MAG: threonine--tRNA ligase [Polyangiaceae bacterium]
MTSALKTAREILLEKGPIDKDVVAVTVNGELRDFHTPIETSSLQEGVGIKAVRANEKLGLEVIRHSTAHVMADAVQRLFPGTQVTIGPAIEDGFYYDFDKAGGGTFSEEDLAKIENLMKEITAENTPFRREVIARDKAIELFTKMGEKYKVDIIERRPPGETLTLYRHGKPESEWVDFCAGPHVPSTGFLGAVKLTSVAGAYWRGDERNPMLQRIYGTAFNSQKALDAYLKQVEEAKARDHRKLGKELDLFHFDPIAPAMPFFLPRGAYVYNAMVSYVRDLYVRYGYDEVITPQAFDPKLFRTSGHLGHYNENMYRLWTEDMFDDVRQGIETGKLEGNAATAVKKVLEDLGQDSFGLKPMNCPSHCVIFGSRRRSYRELPWRMADFGRLHRYERGGVVHGLARVRSFCQDDAHIFCAVDQVSSEMENFIAMVKEAYTTFGFEKFDVKLATRPDKRMGSDEFWTIAENALAEGLKKAGLEFEIAEGEGAFYGPKVEFHVLDALKRSWQLGTIQYDPNLPERFDLSFTASDGAAHRPVMLHRAVLGSLERFFSVYLEHCGGNFPAWLAPEQASVVTVHEDLNPYANEVVAKMKAKGIRVVSDLSNDKLGAKIRNARLQRIPYICVVGKKEQETQSVGVRSRDLGELGAIALDTFIEKLASESRPKKAT